MFNNVFLVGRVVRNPELSQTHEGQDFCNLTLAVTRPYKSTLTDEYETDFLNVTVWEATARNVVQYCGKGSTIGIRGRLKQRVYDVPDFKSIRTIEVVGDRVSFIQTKAPERNLQQEEFVPKEFVPSEPLEVNRPTNMENVAV